MPSSHRFSTSAMVFVLVLVLVGASAVVALLWFSTASAARDADTRAALENLVLAERLRADIERTLASARGFLLAGDHGSLERTLDADADANRERRDIAARIEKDDSKFVDQLATSLDSYEQALKRLLADKTRGADLGTISTQFERDLLPHREVLDRAIDAYIAHRELRLTSILDANRRGARTTLELALTIVLASVIAAGIVSRRTSRRLANAYERTASSERAALLAATAREQLLATVAHDLRSPLSVITIRAALIAKCTDVDKARQQATGIAAASTRMEALIRSLLDAASLEAGRMKLHKTKCDVGEIIRDTIAMFTSLAVPKSIRLESTLPEQGPLELLADKERVLQVVFNLVGNAIKFTPEGGAIQVSAEKRMQEVQVAVSDTGPGIVSEHLPHLFDRFWQAEAGARHGTGLGLYIAKGIVDAHGGRIWVDSEVGHGATFWFTLPCTPG
jgi:signal transduction histidine kinase